MSEAAAKLLEQVLALPEADRAFVRDGLMADLDPPGDELTRNEWKEAWHGEIVRRLDAYDRGEAEAVTLDEFMAGMRRAVREARG